MKEFSHERVSDKVRRRPFEILNDKNFELTLVYLLPKTNKNETNYISNANLSEPLRFIDDNLF